MVKKMRSVARVAIILCLIVGFLGSGIFMLWAANLTMPSWASVEARRIEQSTKIYDRSGEVLLYDLHQEVRRTIIPLEEMSQYLKDAAVAIEDDNFYNHRGIEPTAIVRAVLTNLLAGDLLGGQGGSTITQQVVKNTLLHQEKRISRKFKEWVLALKLEQQLEKDEILELYLNESPYGGNKYGVEEASRAFFDKSAAEVTLAEAAYLAALPQAPTYLSPYGNNRDALDARHQQTLDRMLSLGFISEEEHVAATNEDVLFQPQRNTGINAPHFVFHVIDVLRETYDEDELQQGGLRIITTLDWELQEIAEEIVNRYALENAEKFNAENASLVAVDPRSGDLLVMVGSRDYFDDEIEGNYNIALADRQPGSAFKPFVYAAAIEKGYTSETVVFDVATQFSTSCPADRFTNEDGCYAPVNYDAVFRGPMTFRNALAQSVNVPAVKALYLAGMDDALDLAQRLGITSLGEASRYGLTLVLGGGEVRLLDMAGAYGVFANDGMRAEPRAILRIEDRSGRILRDFPERSENVLNEEVARAINDMLSDNVARTPAFGANSHLHFPGRDVAAKTGTTNDYRDAWILGYTPEIAVGAWAGNNDNRSMEKRVAGFIIAPLWHEFMTEAFKKLGQTENFTKPQPLPHDLKPVLRGVWQYPTGPARIPVQPAPDMNEDEDEDEDEDEENEQEPENMPVVGSFAVHSILHWVNRSDPRGPIPSNPSSDQQYSLWEHGVARWRAGSSGTPSGDSPSSGERPQITIEQPEGGDRISRNTRIRVRVNAQERGTPLSHIEYYINGTLVEQTPASTQSVTISLDGVAGLSEDNTLRAILYDESGTIGFDSVDFSLR